MYFMWQLGYVALMREKGNAYRVSAGKPEGKRPFARYRHRREVIRKWILKENRMELCGLD
jgi:hypothetical protein